MSRLRERMLAEGPLERVIGAFRGAEPGPSLLVVAGIHGNEPAGVIAARRVVATLERERLPLRGDFAIFTGNIGALRDGVRGLRRDLNRGWTRQNLLALSPNGSAAPEDHEQRELFDAIEAARHRARGPVTFLDLHSTSAPGTPFVMVRDIPELRAFALLFHIPVIMGLLELIDHTLLEFLQSEGCTTLGIEGGHNDADSTIDHHEEALWIALVGAGLLDATNLPGLERSKQLLAAARGSRPHMTRIERRHSIKPEDRFRMIDGFDNIQRVDSGQLLAHDRNGEIRAPHPCILLMPLYQEQGDDGFFLGHEVVAPHPPTAHRRAG